MLHSWVQKALGTVFCLVASGCLVGIVHAEQINRFDVQTTLDQNRRLTVEETLEYQFTTGAKKHGILRILPERYTRSWLRYDLHYTVEQVLQDGKMVPWEAERQGADLVLRIGDPVAFVTGTHRYLIRYRTDRAITDFADSHELYWNVTGNEWPFPIVRSSFAFAGVPIQRQTCFTGVQGATTAACSFRPSSDPSKIMADSPSRLGANEGFTVVLEFPKGSLATEPFLTTVGYLLIDNVHLIIPFLLCLLMIFIWFFWGRDPRGRGVIIPQYESPDGLTPGLLAGLMEEQVSSKAITASLLDLARRGYAKVEFRGEDPEEPERILYTRVMKPKANDVLAPYEEELLKAVFADQTEVNLQRPSSDGQWAAYQKVIKVLTDDMLARGWFRKNPGTVRGAWFTLAFIIVTAAFILQAYFYLAVAAVVGILGWYMPKMTPLAAEVRERILGFRLFLMVTEKARLAFSDAPAKRPEQFAEFLPAAVALGVEKEWAKQFEGLLVEPPSYIRGAPANWSSLAYIHALGHMSHAVSTRMTHQTGAGSGSSGFSGGSSGGGFGGGGGGSW